MKNNNKLGVICIQESWDKTWSITGKWLDIMHIYISPDLNTKYCMSDHVFLIYTDRTYDTMVMYMKGIYLSIHSWRGNIDDDGCKLDTSYSKKKLKSKDWIIKEAHEYPNTFKKINKIKHDFKSLKKSFYISSHPFWYYVPSKSTLFYLYVVIHMWVVLEPHW